jgi:hypothetical protein
MPDSRRRDALLAGAIFVVALAVRLLHFREVALHDPYYALPTVDDLQYDAWARRLAAGDGLPGRAIRSSWRGSTRSSGRACRP